MPVPAKPKTDPNLLYPELQSVVRIGTDAITAEEMKQMLGWEDEDSYKVRMGAKDKKKAAIGFGEEFLLKDPAGKKVRCWYNTQNRPFSLSWAKTIAQSILHSGPGIPLDDREWQVNGEPIIIGQTGQFISGQHRGAGLILAVYEYRKNTDYWKKHGGWNSDPVLETVLTVGIPEEPRVTRTIDNVKPRSLSDVFYTSGVFDHLRRTEKERCSSMLEGAVNLLWKRTGVSEDQAHKFQTHGESVSFFDRHPKLLECVAHIHSLNSATIEKEGKSIAGRVLSDINLSPGVCTGVMYLMGASASDPDEYISGIQARSEEALDWSNWDTAKDFWTGLAGASAQFEPVREALRGLRDLDNGEGGRPIEKVGILTKAWHLFVAGEEFTEEGLALEYYKDDVTGELSLIIDDDFPNFGGMDMGEPKKAANPAPPTQEEIAASAIEIKTKNRIEQLDATVKAKKQAKVKTQEPQQSNGQAQKPKDQMLREIKEQHPGKIIMFKAPNGIVFWGNDAAYVGKIIKQQPDKDGSGKLDRLLISSAKVDEVKMRLLAAKAHLAVCENKDGEIVVEDIAPPQKLGSK